MIRTPPYCFFFALRYCQSDRRYSSVTFTHAALASWCFLNSSTASFCRAQELLGIVKIGSLVLGKQVGGDGARVFLGREYRQSHGRAIIQQYRPDLVGAVIAASDNLLHDARLRLITPQGQGLGL